MTQSPYDPNQPPPVSYAGGGYPAAAKPGSVTTLAVMAVILGSLGTLCCGLTGVVGGLAGLATGNRTQLPDGTVYRQDPTVAMVGTGIAGADLVTSVALLAGGIGALAGKRWARSLAVTAAAAIVVVAIARLVITLVVVGPETQRAAAAMKRATPAGQPGAGALFDMMGTGQTVISIVVFLITVGVAGAILLFWTKPPVKAWFEGMAGGPGGGPRRSYPPPGGYPPTMGGGYPPAGGDPQG